MLRRVGLLWGLGTVVCLSWGRGQEAAAKLTEERLPAGQQRALSDLIRSLETLHGESSEALRLWIETEIGGKKAQMRRLEAEIQELEGKLEGTGSQQVQELRGKLQVARQRRKTLTESMNALAASRLLFADASWRTDQVSLEAGQRLFVEQIRPLFEERCKACHGGDSKEAGLDLSSREALLEGGDSGPAIVPGNAKESLLYQLVTHQREPTMPAMDERLSAGVIEVIAEWINSGAPFAAGSRGSSAKQADLTQGAIGSGGPHFERVRPILESRCLVCHGGKFKQVGLDLSTRERLLRGSEQHGPVVHPGNAGASLLVKKIRHAHEPGMPYKGQKLSQEEIAKIVAWIDAEVPYQRALKMPAASERTTEQKAFLHGSDHWAYQAPRRPLPPPVKNQSWVRNPIDVFLAAQHEKRGLQPLPAADKRVLLRRVYLDLVGLPPMPEEVAAFLADDSEKAYEKVVDRLLASPRYGERWGRHWMDIWRYSDWYGWRNMSRNSQRHIWHWRDWIIESLNQDKAYEQMITEMLAADEVAPTNPEVLRATGYLARNFYRYNRHVWLQNTVEHAAAGFLGITLKCARCHDHKYDPIAQEEYYRFRAFFEPHDVRADRVAGQPDLSENGLPRAFDSEPREPTTEAPSGIFAQTYRLIRGNEKNPDKEHPLSPGIPEVLGMKGVKIEPVELPAEAFYPALRPFVRRDLLAQAKSDIQKAEAALDQAQQALAEARERVVQEKRADRAAAGAGQMSFEEEILPIFKGRCVPCHTPADAENGLSLQSLEAVLEGGHLNGPTVIPKKSSESPLIQYLRGERKPRMPLLDASLSEEQIERIAKWIDQLPEEKPKLARRQAEQQMALAQKELAWARANLPALEARIAADKAKYADPPDPEAKALAETAREAERRAHLLKGEKDLLLAQQRLAEALSAGEASEQEAREGREKKVAKARKRLEEAQAALDRATESYTPLGRLYPRTSTGRRTALARMIASKENPLTARVAINHIWMRHFSAPLVATVANFGLNGKPPTHPELLDWLAVEFMGKNWSMKAMHRLMVTSSAYRMQSSTQDPEHPNGSIDPENRYLWRMNPRRMEAETVRDSVLHVAGQLDTTMGGPELSEFDDQISYRRSIYFKHTPDSQVMFLKLFDAADPTDCYQREESIVPQQALALANSQLGYTQARLLTSRLSRQIGDTAGEAAFVVAGFERVLGRGPSPEELIESQNFLLKQVRLYRSPQKLDAFQAGPAAQVLPAAEPGLRARESLIHVLFNHHEFVSIL